MTMPGPWNSASDQKARSWRVAVSATALSLVLVGGSPASAQGSSAHLSLVSVATTPKGAADLCIRHAWACSSPKGKLEGDSSAILAAARDVNRRVNRGVRTVDDTVQYRVRDFWTLPSKRGGDCEDLALLKKQELMRRGVAANRLLMATVYGRRVGAHAVLVLRLDDGDFVLDILNNNIKPWHRTKYTFLRVQNPKAPSTWMTVSTRG